MCATIDRTPPHRRAVLALALTVAMMLAAPTRARADATCSTPVVQTTVGAVCGTSAPGGVPGEPSRPIHAYLGIPFAEPPTGHLRWTGPVPTKPWTGTRETETFGPSCPQHVPPGVEIDASEDCLSLNVWTPDPKGTLPVLVFVYGGSFVHGGTAAPVYGGANLAAVGPAVVVTLNYRIGALGFLAGLGPFTGNYGLLDQQLALQWVHENIAAFGGDPKKVTLFGESAGAMSVGIHLGAATSRGLFRAAILESNPYGIPYKTARQAGAYANDLVGHLDCAPPKNPPTCLREKSAAEIVAAQGKLPVTESFLLGLASFVPWGPVVGGPLLESQPNEISIDKPILIGTNKNEGTLFVAMQERSIGTIDEMKYVLETDIAFGEHGSAVRKLYASIGTGEPAATLSEIVTDDLFVCANRFVLKDATAPKWAYQFTHVPSFPIWPAVPACAPATGQVCHASELPVVFGNPFGAELWAKQASFTGDERKLAATMMRLWTGFAANLRPPETVPPWTGYSVEDPLRLILDEPLSESRDLTARCRFWDWLGYDRSGPLAGLL